MFLVMLVHTGYYALGAPSASEVAAHPADGFMRILLENIAIVCVDVFVLISGWFSIKPKVRSIGGFLFQILFFNIGIYVVMVAAGWAQLTAVGCAQLFCLHKGTAWFIKAYLVLYALSPVLNAFVEHAPRQQLRRVVVWFFVLQTVLGWLSASGEFFMSGYGPVSFIGLYLLARYVRLYRPAWSRWRARYDIGAYLLIALTMTVGAFLLPLLSLRLGNVFNLVLGRQMSYISPFVIAAALALLLGFSKVRLRSRFVLMCGASSFAAYLLQSNPNIGPVYYRQFFIAQHEALGIPAYYAMTLALLLLIFFISVGLDQLRLRAWRVVWARWEARRARRARPGA